MSEATLASVYNLDLENGITKLQFLELCPALIQQTVGGHCNAVPVETTASTAPEKASDLEGKFSHTTDLEWRVCVTRITCHRKSQL